MATVAVVARPQGRRGEVIVRAETDFPSERFAPGSIVHVKRGDAVESLSISSSREHGGRWVLGFEGIASIDDAETLRNRELRVPEASLHALDANEFYAHDLVGCRVVTTKGEDVGLVGRVDFGAGTSLVVGEGKGEVLIPFIDVICRSVDLANKRIVIDPPEGLLEVNR